MDHSTYKGAKRNESAISRKGASLELAWSGQEGSQDAPSRPPDPNPHKATFWFFSVVTTPEEKDERSSLIFSFPT
jgi:hypothetical protein